MPTNHTIAAIGPEALISGLQSIGIATFPAATGEEALAQLKQVRSSGTHYAFVCITESLMNNIPAEALTGKESGSLPAILTIPDLRSDKNAGLEKLRELTKRAIGSDILG